MTNSASATRDVVVLLHGLARSTRSMAKIAASLQAGGFNTCNIGYPSTKHPLEVLAAQHVLPAVLACSGGGTARVHFVTHSTGGLMVRLLEKSPGPLQFGRVVMIAPPSQGTELVDTFGHLALFRWIYGPAALQMGTGPDSVARRLGATALDVGVIAGTRSINPLFSHFIPGIDDGRVAVANTRLDGMRDFITHHASHSFLMNQAEVMRQTAHYLANGAFAHAPQPG